MGGSVHTVSGLFVRHERMLLCRRHDRRTVWAGLWIAPGGHVGAGEAPESALRREMREELGVDVLEATFAYTVHVPPFGQEDSRVDRAYLVTRWDGEPANLDRGEHDDLGWFDRHQMAELAMPDAAHNSLIPFLAGRASMEGAL